MNEVALFKLTQGLYVLGARDEANERFAGSIVDAVMQAASTPLVVALSCNTISYTRECIEKTGEFSISVLSKEVDPLVISNFGFQSSRNVDKWANVAFEAKEGLPFLKDNLATLRAKVLQKIVFESHTLFVAEVLEAVDNKQGEALTYQDYRVYFKTKVFEAIKEKKNV